jgi:hypothetical protein
VVKDVLQLKQFAFIKKLLDSYGFEFYLRTVDEDGNETEDLPEQQEVPEFHHQQEVPEFPPGEHCDCEMCREIRNARFQKLKKNKVQEPGIGFENVMIKMPKITKVVYPRAPKVKVNPRKLEQDRIAKELIEAVNKMKIELKSLIK